MWRTLWPGTQIRCQGQCTHPPPAEDSRPWTLRALPSATSSYLTAGYTFSDAGTQRQINSGSSVVTQRKRRRRVRWGMGTQRASVESVIFNSLKKKGLLYGKMLRCMKSDVDTWTVFILFSILASIFEIHHDKKKRDPWKWGINGHLWAHLIPFHVSR